MAARIGIDTGGTFTDVVRRQRDGVRVHKLPSTPRDPSQAVLAGLAAVRAHADEEVDVVHGTTVGLNAVLTGALARTVFVTNAGCEDLIEIGRQERADLYALAPRRAVPPVPRALRLGVRCRRGPGGVVDTALTAAEIARVVAAVRRLRPASIAIGLLHAPDDDADELALARALRTALPDVPVTTSAALHPASGEYERFTAAILNAAIAPVVGRYTQRLAAGIGRGQLRLLRQNLGILPPDEAQRFPARAMFSGPAGGVLATAQTLAAAGMPCGAAFDMGGTSADVCLVADGVAVHDAGAIAGLPLPLPTVPVHTVGCGGGSIAYVDQGGALRVGPESAGADPGPACYGRSDVPTVTDAHVALGHLGAATLLGGGFPIDVDAAVRAIERLGKKLSLSAAATARGILRIADATMARAVLAITAERAVDPAGVPLVAYGGAGGLHAAGMAKQLGMPFAIVPPLPGAFSALGLALAGDAIERSVACRTTLDAAGTRRLLRTAAELARAAKQALGPAARATVTVTAHARYAGQGAALVVRASPRLGADFAREHQRRYGFALPHAVEVLRLTARAATRDLPLPVGGGDPMPSAARQPLAARRPPVGGARLPVLARAELRGTLRGPAIVEEATATTVVPAGWQATQRDGLLRLTPR